MRFPELASPRSTIGAFSFTSFRSRCHARFVSGSIIGPHSRAVFLSLAPPCYITKRESQSVLAALASIREIFSRREQCRDAAALFRSGGGSFPEHLCRSQPHAFPSHRIAFRRSLPSASHYSLPLHYPVLRLGSI